MTKPPRPIRQIVQSPVPSVLPGHIVLYEQTWSQHISTRHTDVPLHEIETTMSDPCEICTSTTTPGSFVLVNTLATNEYGDQLRVPIKPLGDGTNVVTTAYYGMAPHGTTTWKRGDA